MARVSVALVERADDPRPLAVYGLSVSAAAGLLLSIREGRTPPDALIAVHEVAIPLSAGGEAFLRMFNPVPVIVGEANERAVRVLASEMAYAIDAHAGPIRPLLDQRLEPLTLDVERASEPVAIYEIDTIRQQPIVAYVNPALERFFGLAAAQLVGTDGSIFFGELTDLDRIALLGERSAAGNVARNTVVLYKRDRTPVWIEVTVKPVVEESGAVTYLVKSMRDVTARKEFEAALAAEKRKLQVTLAAIGDAVVTTVGDGRIEFLNAAARDMLGLDIHEAYGETIGHAVRLTNADGSTVDLLRDGTRDGAGVRRGQARFGRGKRKREVAYVSSPIGDEGYVFVLRDITAQNRLATQLSYEASHDALTNLINRRKFEELLDEAVDSARRQQITHALAYIDLDRFKVINDACGHAVGDRVLIDVSHLFQENLRGRDVLARLGGDEFAVLLQDCTLENARRVLEKLRQAVAAYELMNAGRRFTIGASIGLAPISAETPDPSVVLGIADAACYAAKAAGRNAIVG